MNERPRVRPSPVVYCASILIPIALVCGLQGCSSIDSGGYENYMAAAVAHQQKMDEGGVRTRVVVVSGTRQKTMAPARPAVLRLTLGQALIRGLMDNSSLLVQRYSPTIARAGVLGARGVFDPVVTGSVSSTQTRTPDGTTDSDNNATSITGGISQFLPTGTTIAANADTSINNGSGGVGQSTDVGGTLTITQALLKGGNLQANLASIRSAKLGVRISNYELRGVAQTTVYNIITAYWAYALAQQNVSILQTAVNVARQQMEETKAFIRVGRIAGSQLPASIAQLASEEQSLIAAQGALQTARLNLLQLITPPQRAFWKRHLVLLNQPFVPPEQLAPLREHVKLAMKMSPIINQTKLEIMQGDLSVIQTRNGLLPQLNLFLALGKTGYANDFGHAYDNLNGPGYSIGGGLSFSYPLLNRSAESAYQQAELSRDQLEASLANLVQTVELAVRNDYITARTDRKQIAAAIANTAAQAETLKATQGQFRVGEATSLQVAQAQTTLLSAQLTQAQSVVNYLDALATLYLEEGTLLQRSGLSSPGAYPLHWHGPVWLRRWPDGTGP
jgi:outer membrane protein